MESSGDPPIPGPTPLPLLGNVRDIDVKNSVRSLNELAGTYGPIYRLTLGVANVIVISNYALVNEVLSQKRFVKHPVGTVMRMRDVLHDGLVTAFHHEENWSIAHRTLAPAFGTLAVKHMFSEMHDIASQLVLKWARFGPATPMDVATDFQKLALDTLALCAMDTRFNSFYQDEPHPLVNAINGILSEATLRSGRPEWYTKFQWAANRKFDENNAFLHQFALEVIENRRANPSNKKDLVNAMVGGHDPVTGKPLSDATIENNMISFLIAGSETTANMLAFLFFYLTTCPEPYSRLQQEIDDVVGNGPLLLEHLSKLPFTKACLRESLRLQPTIPVLAVKPIDTSAPVLLGGKWKLASDRTMLILLHTLHRDPSVWGDDADEFKPERMLDEKFQKLPSNAWKPFGNGQRACIGSEFAFQEATIATALLMQKFDFRLADPHYKLVTKQAASIKPDGLFIYAKLRPGIDSTTLQADLFRQQHDPTAELASAAETVGGTTTVVHSGDGLRPMAIYYGSNMGTAQELAEGLAQSAIQHGFTCTTAPLDEAVDRLQPGTSTVVVCSTYDGQPTNNASRFVDWVSALQPGSLTGLGFAVFGCGNREWTDTFQRIPNLIHTILETHGARPLAPKGSADAAEGDVLGQFQAWQANHLWPSLAKLHGAPLARDAPSFNVQIVNGAAEFRPSAAGVQARVTKIQRLTTTRDRLKYHMELRLPVDAKYEVGDYIEVQPANSPSDVGRAIQALGLKPHTALKVDSSTSTTLPTGMSISAESLFGRYLELNQPATLKQIEQLRDSCTEQPDRETLTSLLTRKSLDSATAVRRPSVLGILEACSSVALPLSQLIGLFPVLRPRLYSISSSPRPPGGPGSPTGTDTSSNTNLCTITWSLIQHEHPAVSASQSHDYQASNSRPGLASGFLTGLRTGETLPVSLKSGQALFRPAPPSVPMVMVCAGAGLAPFRGFVQHRAALLFRGGDNPSPEQQLAPALLFIGCRTPEDKLYADEMETWERQGAVRVFYAFSQKETDSGGCKYAQDRMWREQKQVMELVNTGARIYVCGHRRVNAGVQDTMRRMYKESEKAANGKVLKDDEVEKWWARVRRERYAVDVF